MATVTILLAAYNGENYIQEMVDSILAQTFLDWHLVLSDDGSTDATASLLEDYAQRHSDKITHYRSGMKFGCAEKHFMHLLSVFHETPYIMFCDQDDIWHADKIEKTLGKMQQIEDPALPALVHTDLRVVDRNLNVLNPSFCDMSNIDGSKMALNQLLIQNVVTGCTMMINHNLAALACCQIPEKGMMMHDWWLAILAAAFGKTGFLKEATIDYRQHGNNSVGAKNIRSVSYLWKRFCAHDFRDSMANIAGQAELFLSCFRQHLSKADAAMIKDFASICKISWFKRNCIFLKYRIYKHGFTRIVAQILGW